MSHPPSPSNDGASSEPRVCLWTTLQGFQVPAGRSRPSWACEKLPFRSGADTGASGGQTRRGLLVPWSRPWVQTHRCVFCAGRHWVVGIVLTTRSCFSGHPAVWPPHGLLLGPVLGPNLVRSSPLSFLVSPEPVCSFTTLS